jgi:hypothetical protein
MFSYATALIFSAASYAVTDTITVLPSVHYMSTGGDPWKQGDVIWHAVLGSRSVVGINPLKPKKKSIIFVRRFPGYARSSFWYE